MRKLDVLLMYFWLVMGLWNILIGEFLLGSSQLGLSMYIYLYVEECDKNRVRDDTADRSKTNL